MNTVYILMVLTAPQSGGYHGSGVLAFQEFTTPQRCEQAKSLIVGDQSIKSATCVQK